MRSEILKTKCTFVWIPLRKIELKEPRGLVQVINLTLESFQYVSRRKIFWMHRKCKCFHICSCPRIEMYDLSKQSVEKENLLNTWTNRGASKCHIWCHLNLFFSCYLLNDALPQFFAQTEVKKKKKCLWVTDVAWQLSLVLLEVSKSSWFIFTAFLDLKTRFIAVKKEWLEKGFVFEQISSNMYLFLVTIWKFV